MLLYSRLLGLVFQCCYMKPHGLAPVKWQMAFFSFTKKKKKNVDVLSIDMSVVGALKLFGWGVRFISLVL